MPDRLVGQSGHSAEVDMTIEQRDKIDFVTITKAGEVLLSISDHLPWDDQRQHLYMLQEKLNAYLRFVESGELREKFPEAAGMPIVFNVVANFELPEAARAFIASTRKVIIEAGFELRVNLMRPN
jgi:hypothetical protein